MLARRFTIVCLLTTLFGMGFATLVAGDGRSARAWDQAGLRLCGLACPDSYTR